MVNLAYPVDVEGNLTIQNNGQVNVVAKSVKSYSNIMTYIGGTITSQTGGLLHVELDNNDDSSANPYVLQLGSGANLNVINQGNLQLLSDGTGNTTLMQTSGSNVNINNPGKTVVFDLDTTHTDPSQKQVANSSSKISNAQFDAYSVSVNNNGNEKGAYYQVHIPSGGTIQRYDMKQGKSLLIYKVVLHPSLGLSIFPLPLRQLLILPDHYN
ncbi:hypothetical protein ACYATO_08360 [Lactobacillaceae bacterium Melli_B3]